MKNEWIFNECVFENVKYASHLSEMFILQILKECGISVITRKL